MRFAGRAPGVSVPLRALSRTTGTLSILFFIAISIFISCLVMVGVSCSCCLFFLWRSIPVCSWDSWIPLPCVDAFALLTSLPVPVILL